MIEAVSISYLFHLQRHAIRQTELMDVPTETIGGIGVVRNGFQR